MNKYIKLVILCSRVRHHHFPFTKRDGELNPENQPQTFCTNEDNCHCSVVFLFSVKRWTFCVYLEVVCYIDVVPLHLFVFIRNTLLPERSLKVKVRLGSEDLNPISWNSGWNLNLDIRYKYFLWLRKSLPLLDLT